jgi:hypothetical protein
MEKIKANLDDVVIVDQEYSGYTADILTDQEYAAENRRHMTRMAKLDHFFEYATHTSCLLVLTLTSIAAFLCTRFLGTYYEIPALTELTDSLWTMFSYLLCALFTYLLTEFLNNKKSK